MSRTAVEDCGGKRERVTGSGEREKRERSSSSCASADKGEKSMECDRCQLHKLEKDQQRGRRPFLSFLH